MTTSSNMSGLSSEIPTLRITDFDSTTPSNWPIIESPNGLYDEQAFFLQLSQLPLTAFDFKEED